MNLQELREDKGRLANEAQAILDAQTGAEMRKEDEAKFDKIHDDIEKRSKDIARLEKQDALAASLAEKPERRSDSEIRETNHSGSKRTSSGKITEADRNEAFRTWCIAGGGADLIKEQIDNARRCGWDVNAKRLNMHFGPRMMATTPSIDGLRVGPDDLRKWQGNMDETRAALTGIQSTTTTGGYTTPDAAMRSLEVALLAYGGMRTVSTVLRTSQSGPLPIPYTNDTSNKGERIAENTTNNELEMTFGQLVLNGFKYSSKYILASIEFLQDTSINVSEFIGSALGDRIGRIQNDEFTTGGGTTLPNGIITAATSSAVTLSGVASVSYDNIVDLIHSIDPAYRNNGRFMFHDGGLKMLKKVKVLQYSGDTTGYPLWTPGLAMGQPDLIAGYPYTINQSMTTPATGVKSILFGDFSKYIIRDVRDFTLIRLDERFAEFGQVAFLAFARADGNLLDAG